MANRAYFVSCVCLYLPLKLLIKIPKLDKELKMARKKVVHLRPNLKKVVFDITICFYNSEGYSLFLKD